MTTVMVIIAIAAAIFSAAAFGFALGAEHPNVHETNAERVARERREYFERSAPRTHFGRSDVWRGR